jgi:hypothetical protein
MRLMCRNAVHRNFRGVISLIYTKGLFRKNNPIDWIIQIFFENPSIQKGPYLLNATHMSHCPNLRATPRTLHISISGLQVCVACSSDAPKRPISNTDKSFFFTFCKHFESKIIIQMGQNFSV